MRRRRRPAIRTLILASALAVYLFAALPVQAEPSETLLQTTATAVNTEADSWVVTAEVANVGDFPALPQIVLSVVSRDPSGAEDTIAVFNRKGALPPNKSFSKSFEFTASSAADVFVTAEARNAPLSHSEPIPVPVPPVVVGGLLLTLGLVAWRRQARTRRPVARPVLGPSPGRQS
jgi:hypothetical protein